MYVKGKIIGALQLIVVLLAYSIWTTHITLLIDPNVRATAIGLFFIILSIAFLITPIVGLIALFYRKRWGHLCLAGFPIIAFTFGVTAVPFLKYLYGTDAYSNSIIILIVNSVMAAACIWLYMTESV
jgi:hypothetical protein